MFFNDEMIFGLFGCRYVPNLLTLSELVKAVCHTMKYTVLCLE
jgi:hypothetical protein